MTVLGKNNWFKRITALVLALLMMFTLVPLETNVAKAEEGDPEVEETTSVEYTFTVTDAEGHLVEGAEVYLYSIDEDTTLDTDVLSGTTNADGKVTFSSDSDPRVANAKIYKVYGTGTQTSVRGIVGTEKDIDVSLASLGLYLSCVVNLDNVPQSGVKVYLLKATNDDAVADVLIAEQFTDVNGYVQFTKGLEQGDYELVAINDNYMGTVQNSITENDVPTSESGEQLLTIVNGITLSEKTDTAFSLTETVTSLSVGETSTIVPTDTPTLKIGIPSYTYVSNDINVATVDQNGTVTAVGKGETTITVTMMTEEYKTATAVYTVTVSGASITGTVTDGNGVVNGATATLINEADSSEIQKVTVTDGNYSFDAIGVGTYKVKIDCLGYASSETEVKVEDESGTQPIVVVDISIVRDSYNISGVVKDANGNLLEGITVKLVQGSVTSAEGVTAENTKAEKITDAETAVFSLGYFIPGTYTIVISDENYKTSFTEVTLTDADVTQNIILNEKVTVTFKNIDLLTKVSLENQSVNSIFTITRDIDPSVVLDEKDFNISYTVDSDNVITIDSKGKITDIKGIGEAEITVSVSSDLYEINTTASTLTYKVNVWEFAFANNELKETIEKTFGDGNFSTKAVLKGVDNTTKEVEVTYTSSNENIAKMNEVTEEGTGRLTDVEVEIVGASLNDEIATISAKYGDVTINYQLKVKKAPTAGLKWNLAEDETLSTKAYMYGGEVDTVTASVSEGIKGITIEYFSSHPEIVSVAKDTGVIEIKDVTAEDEKVTITAKTVSQNYEEETISYDITVAKGTQNDFAWQDKDGNAYFDENEAKEIILAYDEEVPTIVAGGQYEGDTAIVTYTVENESGEKDESVISVDASTGIFKINGVGTAIVKATVVENAHYNEETIFYKVIVNKATDPGLHWSLAEGETLTTKNYVYNGEVDIITASVAENVKGVTIEYSSTDSNIVSVDKDTGVIEIKDVTAENEKVTITAKTVSNNYEEQTCSYDVTVGLGTQNQFGWKDANGIAYNFGSTPDQITVEYRKNVEVPTIIAGGQYESDTATVMYIVENENGEEDTSVVSVNPSTGAVTVNSVGTAIIKATLAKNAHYEGETITYKIIVNKAEQLIAWSTIDLSAINTNKFESIDTDNFAETGEEIKVIYGKVESFKLGITGQHDDLSYEFTTESDTSVNTPVAEVKEDGTVIIYRQGTMKITYTATEMDSDLYNPKTLSYTLVVLKANQDELAWSNGYADQTQADIIYAPSKTITNVVVVNACSEASVTYASDKTEVATVDEQTGVVTIHKVGLVTITATATVAENGNYNTKSISYTYNVIPSSHTAFSWKGGNPGTVKLTYEDAAPNPVAEGQCESAAVTYSSNNTDVATVNSNGVVTIKKSGEVTITATASATTNYKETSISYKIVIAKKAQTISFEEDTYTLINGDNKFVSPVISKQSETSTANKIVYSVPENNGVVTINSTTGELSFSLQPGTVTVTAIKPEDDQYFGTSTTYTLTVKEWDPLKGGASSPYYIVTGKQEDSSTTWFTRYTTNNPILLVAGEDYALYKNEKDPVPNTTWASSIHVSNVHEGTDNTITFYIKDTVNGYVSKQYTVNNIKADSVVPNAAIAIDDVTIWEKILSFFTFGLAGQDTPELKITSSDETSGVKNVYYYISNTTEPLESNGLIDVNALEKEADWKSYNSVVDLLSEEVTKNVIYAKVVDRAGNSAYVATNGLIFDGAKPVLTPTIVTKDNNGYYNGNVEIKLDVLDAEPYSGIQKITYVVQNGNEVTDEGTLFTFKPASEGNPKHSELVSTWDSSKQNKNVIVNAADNNSDNVKVTFTVVDNAGNIAESVVDLKIDITVPVITVSYNNNAGDTTFTDGVYYNTDRTATITVTERHFDSERVVLTITNTDGTIPALSEWTKTSNGTGNGDDATHTATVTFSADGDYTFDISCTDVAENANAAVNYGESQAPTAFTIDKTAPIISVSYDNNEALNDNYYKADRTATITIQEHNFEASRVSPILTATDDGTTVSNPTVSGWSSSGDTHTAYINYSSDALYTFDIEYADKAGNVIADVAEQTFYVDKTTPQVSITEIVDQSANNAEIIGFVITATDTNFDVFTPVLTAVVQTENGFTTTELDVASISEITNGQVYTVDNLESDGIYSITCTAVDKAGNEYTEVTLQRADGSTYVESRAGEDTLITFSVNRDGSTFDIDANTKDVLDRYYVQNVEDDLVIYEVNTNELLSYAISLNGEELAEGTDYSVSSSGGDGQWMRYTYTVNKELFENEGEYVLVISSTDGAENNAFSDVKDANISFVVDRTAPVVTVTGMESDRSYQTESQTVTLMPTDDGGMVESLVVNKVDRDGNVEKEILSYSGDELRENLDTNGGTITFTLSEGLNQRIQVICTDASYSTDGQPNTYNQTFENVSVSASAIAIFFAGNTLLYIGGGVAGVGVATGAVVFFIKRPRGPKVPKAPKKDKKK